MIFLMLGLRGLVLNPYSPLIQSLETSTWSIVAIDPETGDVGVAAASCVPDIHADALAALVPGKGAAVVQAHYTDKNRARIYRLLKEGLTAEEIIRQMIDPEKDDTVSLRQYGVVAINDGVISAEAYTGSGIPGWAGSQQDISMGVTVQGNILVREEVVSSAIQAFVSESDDGHNALPDRLMRALEAGSAVGGDSRCNNGEVQQTAATAFILVARSDDEPYAKVGIGRTDMGTDSAPWLAISVTESEFGPNPLIELRSLYNNWREENLTAVETSAVNPLIYAAVIILLIAFALFARRRLKHK